MAKSQTRELFLIAHANLSMFKVRVVQAGMGDAVLSRLPPRPFFRPRLENNAAGVGAGERRAPFAPGLCPQSAAFKGRKKVEKDSGTSIDRRQ